MKRCLVALLAVVLLVWSLPAVTFAASSPLSLGVSPSHASITMVSGGSAGISFTIYYYTGDVQITVVGLPADVSPDLVSVSDPPYGSAVLISTSAAPGTYSGYLRFQSVSGSVGLAVSMAVQIEVVMNVAAPAGGGGGYVPPPTTTTPPAPTTEPIPVPEPTPAPIPTIPPTMPTPIPVPTPVPTPEPIPTLLPEPTVEPTSAPEPSTVEPAPTTEPPQVVPPDIIDDGISTSMWFVIGGGSLLVIIGIGVLGSYAWKRWCRAG